MHLEVIPTQTPVPWKINWPSWSKLSWIFNKRSKIKCRCYKRWCKQSVNWWTTRSSRARSRRRLYLQRCLHLVSVEISPISRVLNIESTGQHRILYHDKPCCPNLLQAMKCTTCLHAWAMVDWKRFISGGSLSTLSLATPIELNSHRHSSYGETHDVSKRVSRPTSAVSIADSNTYEYSKQTQSRRNIDQDSRLTMISPIDAPTSYDMFESGLPKTNPMNAMLRSGMNSGLMGTANNAPSSTAAVSDRLETVFIIEWRPSRLERNHFGEDSSGTSAPCSTNRRTEQTAWNDPRRTGQSRSQRSATARYMSPTLISVHCPLVISTIRIFFLSCSRASVCGGFYR